MGETRTRIRRRLFSLLLHPWFRLRRGMTLGVRGLVRDEMGRVLLVRHSYMHGWHLPGGGVERGETAEAALARELAEEGGIELAGRPALFGIYSNDERFAGDHVLLYLVDGFRQQPWQPNWEIAEARFFARDALPADTSDVTFRRLAEVLDGAKRATLW